MPLVHVRGNLIRSIGTCFAITGGGLCLTARHVIEDAWVAPFVDGRDPTDDDGSIFALYSSPVKNEDHPDKLVGGLVPITHAYVNFSLDIAVVHLNLPRHVTTGEPPPLLQLQLGLAPPTIGQACMAIGYHSATWEVDDDNVALDHQMSASRGTIEELHIPQRDSVMAPFPCFRTSARYDGGMSGGPVITEDGLVRGVVCSSLSLGDAEGYTSLASMIGVATLINLRGKHGPNGEPESLFLWDFVAGGAVKADATGFAASRQPKELGVQFGGGRFTNVLSS